MASLLGTRSLRTGLLALLRTERSDATNGAFRASLRGANGLRPSGRGAKRRQTEKARERKHRDEESLRAAESPVKAREREPG